MSALLEAPAVDPDSARAAARHILSDRRFRPSSTPRPLRGPLKWLGDRITSASGHLGNVLGNTFGGATRWVWLTVAAPALIFAVWAIAKRRRHRAQTGARKGASAVLDEAESADALERAADEAERGGDLAGALRLRFRAGLLRLGDRGAITYRPSVTTGEVRRAVGSERFDGLAETFEAVAYGGRAADPPDLDRARVDWPRVLEETKSR